MVCFWCGFVGVVFVGGAGCFCARGGLWLGGETVGVEMVGVRTVGVKRVSCVVDGSKSRDGWLYWAGVWDCNTEMEF